MCKAVQIGLGRLVPSTWTALYETCNPSKELLNKCISKSSRLDMMSPVIQVPFDIIVIV